MLLYTRCIYRLYFDLPERQIHSFALPAVTFNGADAMRDLVLDGSWPNIDIDHPTLVSCRCLAQNVALHLLCRVTVLWIALIDVFP